MGAEMTKDEALKLALATLRDYVNEYGPWSDDCGVRYVLRLGKKALAQPEQELVDSDEIASAYMADQLQEFVETASAFPKAKVDFRLWDRVMVFAPKKSEPVAWMREDEDCTDCIVWEQTEEHTIPLYTTPPQRKPLPPQSPCEMTQAEGKIFKLGWLECEAAHGIKE